APAPAGGSHKPGFFVPTTMSPFCVWAGTARMHSGGVKAALLCAASSVVAAVARVAHMRATLSVRARVSQESGAPGAVWRSEHGEDRVGQLCERLVVRLELLERLAE